MKKKKLNIFVQLWWVLPLFAFDLSFYYFVKYLVDGGRFQTETVVLDLGGFIFTFIISLISIGCVRLTDRTLNRFRALVFPWKYLYNIVISFFLFIFIVVGFQYFIETGGTREFSYYLNNSIVFLFLHLVVGNAAIAVLYFQNSKHLSEKLLLLEKVKTENELKILQQQMSPHFLFNNLNTLTSLIPVNQEKAIIFTRKLSSVFRHATDHADKELISLQAEIHFLHDYMELLSHRFGESYQLEQHLGDLDFSKYLSIPMALQVVIENVVKHNAGSKSNPLKIIMKSTDDFLVISNEIRLKLSHEEQRTGVGLKNLNQQFLLVTGRSIVTKDDDQIFSVQLPLIKEIRDEDIDH